MIVPSSKLRMVRRSRSRLSSRAVVWIVVVAVLAGIAGWTTWVEGRIGYYATHDEARPADAIAVFGAAEYDGRPSPVLLARLEHGLELYRENIAPLIITLGGSEATDVHSEGGVGRDFLLAHGVPDSAIIAETKSDNTEQSVKRLAAIARENELDSIVVVSDGTHLFRVHALCASMGLHVFTSPRRELRQLPFAARFKRNAHEVLSYSFWRLTRE